ncbi:Ferric siderophore transport system, periplasmic binding protein TonB [Mucinivorans hirudinis]|uniref:Ferric siderophore transport system, periplasmic binding protein TonB n=1 Tax=Mucinivorans hirudinis TaxID=1433126 RepID=A0A060R8D1_9BACT|nr:Ferric siderophore transport system, periplasmic binding protein TonB [Mucinivorans hirudinis]
MELKKSPKADLQNKKSSFLLTGIVIALCVTISLFSWSKSEKVIDSMELTQDAVEEDLTEITIQEEQKVEIPKQTVVVADLLNIVTNDTKITQDASNLFNDDLLASGDFVTKTFTKSSSEDEVTDDVPVLKADKMPTFQGGTDNDFRLWVQKGLTYPQVAADNGIQGQVIVQFVVERDGSVSNIKVLRSVDRELDAAAVNKIKSSPKWAPGENRGRPVRVTFTIPVVFKLQ